jgi:hypothetical protein
VSFAPLFIGLLLGCSGTTEKPTEVPSAASDSVAVDSVAVDSAASDSASPASPQVKPAGEPPPSEVKKSPAKNNTIPDDYALTAADCEALGKQYGAAMRSDQLVGLSPKLTEKQRAQGEANIDGVVSKTAAQWTHTCHQSLVGKIVDPKTLNCALDAKTVNAFQACISDGSPPSKK